MENRREFLKKSATLAGVGSVFTFPMKVNGDDDIAEDFGKFKVEDIIKNAYCNLSVTTDEEEILSRKEKRKPRKVMSKLGVKNITVKDGIHTVNYIWLEAREKLTVISYQVVAPNGKKGKWRSMDYIHMYSNDTLKITSDCYA